MQRRLAAILAADVVGYSRLMGEDESATLELLRHLRSDHLGPAVAGHNGNVVKSMGDGWLIEFQSAVDAVSAAMHLQDSLAEHPSLKLRVGVHIGDVTHEEGDIFGDGVNVASRLEAIAEPGGIAISGPTFASLDGTLSPSFDDIGPQTLKNIARPVQVWVRSRGDVSSRTTGGESREQKSGYPRLTILPFGTSDPRSEVQELAQALTSDVKSYLGHLSWLDTEIAAIPAASGYRLTAALRTGGDRLRLEARLFTPEGDETWTRKFDGALTDSFDWQDRTGEAIASEVIGMVLDAETRHLMTVDPSELSAEQCLLGGMMTWRSYSPESFFDTLTLHKRAIDANPNLLAAYAEAIIVLIAGKTLGYHEMLASFEAELPKWLVEGRKHVGANTTLDLGVALADFMQNRDAATMARNASDALRRAPFDPRVLVFSGWSYIWCGRTEQGLDCFLKGLRIGRFSPFFVACLGGAATASVQLGQPEEALEHVRAGLDVAPTYATFHAVAAAAYAMLDRMEEASSAMAQHMELSTTSTISAWRDYNDYGGSEGGKRYFQALHKAGMPE